jgi:ferric-dicitrate binding protein FerR (iron transport regulator)
MQPNQRLVYSKASKEMTLAEEPDAGLYIAWTEGWYPFKNESLNNVLQKLERYYHVQFSMNESGDEEFLPVSGKLHLKKSIDEVLAVLSVIAEFDYEIDENIITIKKK